MDYIVRDSSIYTDPDAYKVRDSRDGAIRIGIVREIREVKEEKTRYIVEVFSGGRQVPVSCELMTRWGGAHNLEEYRVRPYIKTAPGNMLLPSSASKYDVRSGDMVVIAFLEGNAREGIILGGIRHPSREELTNKDNIEYLSRFNGVETQIRKDGSYKVVWNGLPVNDIQLNLPPLGQPIPAPIYNPLLAGSYMGFDKKGSFVASDGKQLIKISKDLVSGTILLLSGKNRIEMGGNPAMGTIGVKTDTLVMEALQASLKTTLKYSVETLQLSLKGTQVAIGNDQFELFDGLIKLIDALGTLVVTSPVGTCTPLMSAPTWAAQVLPIKIQLTAVKGSLGSAESFSASSADTDDFGEDVGSG